MLLIKKYRGTSESFSSIREGENENISFHNSEKPHFGYSKVQETRQGVVFKPSRADRQNPKLFLKQGAELPRSAHT